MSGQQAFPTPADTSHAGSRRTVRVALALLSVLIVGTAALVVAREFEHVREVEAARLQSIARLRARQVEQWLADRVAQVGFLSGSPMLAEYFERLAATSDPADRARLLERLETYRRASGYEEAIVLDGQARVIASERGEPSEIAPELADAARQALASGHPRHTGLYLRRGEALPVRIDFVAPLRSTGSPARAALVLRADPRRQLFPMLQEWPTPSPSGQTVLWRRDAERAVALSEPRGAIAPEKGVEAPMSDTSRPAIRLLRGDARAGDVIDGVDFAGNAVIATGQPIAGTDWWLIARVGRDEILAPARRFAWAVAAAVAMALVAAAVGARVLAQRAELARTRRERDAQRERIRTLALLEAIAQSSDDAIYAKDPQGRYLLYNRAACAEVGLPAEQVLGRDDHAIFPAAQAAAIMANDAHALAGGDVRIFEETISSVDGERVKLATKGPLRDPEGNVIGVFGVSRDVTERRRMDAELARHRDRLEDEVRSRTRALEQANAALGQTERFLREVTDNLPGRVAYWDAELRCRFANRAYYAWYGRTQAEVLGRTVLEVFGEAQYALARGRIQAALRGEPQDFERPGRRVNGEQAWDRVLYVPDTHDGAVHGFLVLTIDVTAIRRASADLVRLNAELTAARDRAEAASRAKSAFLANMSHEIRTPMNAIIGLTHLIRRDNRDPVQRDRLAKVADATRHLLDVLNDILELSKIESGMLELEDTAIERDTLVARAFEMVAQRARARGLDLLLETDGVPASLRGDPTRLSQALINLLSNAVKFTEHGWVRLRTEVLERDDERVTVRFEVRDTGIGIAADRQAVLFNAFEQADASTTRHYGGTGLGLALTRRLARLMGGDAGLVSTEGEGSTFWFTARLGVGPPSPADRAPLSGLRVMITGSSAPAREALRSQLASLGARCEAFAGAEDGARAARAARDAADPYTVLVVDADGLPDARAGGEAPPAGSRVLVTARDDDATWKAASTAGFDAVLVKPVTASALCDAIARLAVGASGNDPAPTAGAGPAEAALRREQAGARILVAEDNPVNQEVALDLLDAVGLRVDLAADGASALEHARSTPYDAILMDMQMPGMDGVAATRAIRAEGGANARTAIIAMTANAFGDDRRLCLDAGMNDHVGKPVDAELLYATLLRWMPRRDVRGSGARDDAARDGASRDGAVRDGSTRDGAARDGSTRDGAARDGAARDDRGRDAARPVDGAVATALSTRLAEVAGLDVERALRNLGGREEILGRVIAQFADVYQAGAPGLAETIVHGDRDAMARIAHSVAGACAAIGASEVRALAQALAAPGGGDAPPGDPRLAAAAARLDAALASTARALRAALPG